KDVILVMWPPYRKDWCFLPSVKEAHFYAGLLLVSNSLRNSWALGEVRRFAQVQLHRLLERLEKRFAAAEDHRMHSQLIFINQASLRKLRNELATAEDHHVLAWLLFQVCDDFCRIVFHQPDIAPFSPFHLLQRA